MLALSVAKSSDVWMGYLYSDWKWKQFECCEAWKPVDICGDGLIWTPLPSFLHWTVIFFSCLGFWQRTDSFQYAFEESDSFPQSSSLQRVKFPLPYSPLYISNCHSLQKLANFWAHLCPPLMPSCCCVTTPKYLSLKMLGWQIELDARIERMISRYFILDLSLFHSSTSLCMWHVYLKYRRMLTLISFRVEVILSDLTSVGTRPWKGCAHKLGG